MKCPLCGLAFREQDGRAGCAGCASLGACSLIKCPNCGYEVPAEPGILRRIKKWRRRKRER